MKLLINDTRSNMIANVKASSVPRIGEELMLMSTCKRYAVTDVIHVFDEDCEGDGYIIQVLELGADDSTGKCEMPEWLQLAH